MTLFRPFSPSLRGGFEAFARVFRLLPDCALWLGVGLALPGQLLSQQSSTLPNCNSSLADCTNTVPQQQSGIPTNPTADPFPERSDQTRDRDNNSVYIDPGISSARNSTQRTERPPATPEDPITDLQRLARSSTGEVLPIYGRDFFQNVPSTFAPGDELAAPSDYIIGPQDVLLVRLWGPETFNSQLTVDRSGSIYIPKVGAIHVAGLRFDELHKQIQDAMNRVYRNYNLTVNLGSLRSIQVYVVGEARRPAAYTVSSLSTVLNVLFVSGGPNVRGSMRRIQIRRNGTTLPEFDLYDIVLRGDKSRDVRLESGDVLFIPPVGPQAVLAGSVRHPAIYEIKNENTLKDLLDLAGGFSATGAPSTLSLDRIDPTNTRQTLTIPVDAADLAMSLHDGDVIFAGHISAGYTKTVTLRGNVANPGRFAWHSGMRLNEILPDRMALLTNEYWVERNRLGVPTPLFEPLTDAQTTRLQEESRSGTVNPSRQDDRSYPNAQNLDLSDSTQASNLTTDNLKATQNSVTSRTTSDSARNLGQVGPAVGGVAAAPDPEEITAARNFDAMQAAGMRSPLNRVQIPAPEINWSYAVIERLDPNTLKSSLVPFNLGRLVQEHDPSQNLELQPGDIVTILSQRDIPVSLDAQTRYIRLEGEFVSPGVYSSNPGETLADVVRKAGGLTPRAYLYGSSFLRDSARVFQQQHLDEYITQLSADMDRALAVRSVSSGLDPTSITEQRNIISRLRSLRATGRIILAFSPDSKGTDSIPSLQLENGDVFRVPATPVTISVIGAVHGQNVFLYDSKAKFADYLRLAGNTNRVADKKEVFIIRADGSILDRTQTKTAFSNHFDSEALFPGDSIVIPEKLIRPSAVRQLLDYSQILSSFGFAAAAIEVIR